LQFIGVKWSVFFKEVFTNFSNYEGAWASLRAPLSNNDIAMKRREYFLGHQRKKPSVQGRRQEIFKSIFFMSQLPDSPFEGSTAVEGEEEVEYARPNKRSKKMAARSRQDQVRDFDMDVAFMQPQPPMMAMQYGMQQQVMPQMSAMPMQVPPQPTGYPGNGGYTGRPPPAHQSILNPFHSDEYDTVPDSQKPKSKMETKQYLLHLLSTELLINTRLHGDFTCSRSEFFSWSPSLPHSTITSVLSFFGLSKKWLGFFRAFLEAPLKFTEDGPSAETRPRQRGVPGAHALSSVCGETILFCMDYAVNQATNGTNLYRMNDDFWVFDRSHETVVKAWAAITKFADTMGVTLNNEKTGTVRIVREPQSPSTGNPFRTSPPTSQASMGVSAPIDPSLPAGEIRWGFLIMDPLSGQFVIDQDMVSTHVTELETQLSSKSSSIFAYIQAWNTYAGTFFSSNFGKPANCFGRQHVDEMLSTFTRIQEIIFPSSNVVQHLKQEIEARFGITDIPDGYLYFPTSLGGLDLQNPFIGLIQVRDGVFESPSSTLSEFLDSEREAYRQASIAFNGGLIYRHSNFDPNFIPHDSNVFFSFEEFCRYREEFACDYSGNLLGVFEELMRRPEKEGIDVTGDEEAKIGALVREWMESGKADDVGYLKWVVKLFGEDMKERFGGWNVVEKGLLPMGMVGLFRSGRVKWQG
jgi:hypothetical protein